MRITLCEIWAEGGATHAKERELDLEDGVIAEEALAQAGRKLASGEGLSVFGRCFMTGTGWKFLRRSW